MINDSVPWRAELYRVAARLRVKATQKRWSEVSSYLVERDLMVGFFAIRRLVEAEKTSSLLIKRRVDVRVLPLIDAEPTHFDRWEPWRYYDFESRQRSQLDVKSLFHEFVHSFILTLVFDDSNVMTGVLVASDRTKRTRIYEVPLDAVIDLFNYISREDVVWWSMHRLNGGTAGYRLSQHDLVEAGFADYEDDRVEWHVMKSPITTEYLQVTFPGATDYHGGPLTAEKLGDHN